MTSKKQSWWAVVWWTAFFAFALIFIFLFIRPYNTSNTSLVVGYSLALNASVAPIDEFCKGNNMEKYSYSYVVSKRGLATCIDNVGEVHFYNVEIRDNVWKIGNNYYQAEFEAKK